MSINIKTIRKYLRELYDEHKESLPLDILGRAYRGKGKDNSFYLEIRNTKKKTTKRKILRSSKNARNKTLP